MGIVIGVLALQGDFIEHRRLLSEMTVESIEVRTKQDLGKCSGLIIPGGESTVISKLMAQGGLDSEIKKRVKGGMPLYGTCAGAIVIARKVLGERGFKPLGLIDIAVQRNAYGSQADSFEADVEINEGKNIKGIFIRSPKLKNVGRNVSVLGRLGKEPVIVRQGRVIASVFHPEIAGERTVHSMLLGLMEK